MFERKTQDLISRSKFYSRQLRFSLYACILLCFSLAIGVVGYMTFAELPLVDAVLNASMILTGMGPVNTMATNGSKWFASIYAIYSGVAFLSIIGIFIAPIVHRFLHKVHLEDE